MSTGDIPLTISWFSTGMPDGPAYGDPERTTWGAFASVFWWRREGLKDGPCFIPARFTLEADGRHVRRLKRNLLARTAICLDIETHKLTGEIPPKPADVVERIRERGWAGIVYTSHSNRPEAPRYRIVVALSEEIDHELPAPEVITATLGLDGVTDTSKYGAASLFYLPSMESEDDLDHHDTIVIDGAPIDATWMRDKAGAILADRQVEQECIAAVAHAEAARRREAKIAAGFDPDDSLIAKLRSRFDLAHVLRERGYDESGGKYRHPNSQSGSYGADIRVLDDGIERVFSHNAGDPLHASNLPDWCGGVTALDAIDATIILDFGGDRTKALAELAQRHGFAKTNERKAVAALLFQLIRGQVEQDLIDAAAFEFGKELGLTRDDVRNVAVWVSAQFVQKAA